uniref:Auxin response factor n=1 Tax=Oryza punctata TaxID=4537 RepID=A0A0E0KX75_ORYPU
MARPPAATPPPPPVDRLVWLACAAPLSRIPVVGTQVFYFPDGHAEQCPAPLPDPLPSAHRFFLCTITAVHLAADTATGEPYATISLLPLRHDAPAPAPAAELAESSEAQAQEFHYYAKQLTQSDANNGGGFSVPRLCADHIFPALNFEDDPPVQSLTMGDLQGDSWEFRHIYRGTPRRHLLTTGWSKFVNAKLLVAGDTVVFMCCPPDGKLLVGVRRAPRYSGDSPCNARARVQPQEVMEAVRLAAEQAPFTVTYYPRHGAGEFVVPRVEVDKGLTTPLRSGMQVRVQVMEAEDTRRLAWLNGTLKYVHHQQIWRTLEVDWDASAASSSSMKNRFVNPWQVQTVDFPPIPMGLKISNNSITAPMDNGDSLLVPPMLLHPQPPAAIQGARHNNGHAYADTPSSLTPSMVRTQQLFPRDLQILVPPTDIVNPQNGSPSNNSLNTPPSASDGMKTIQLFGVTITSPVQGDTNAAFSSAQVNQRYNMAGPDLFQHFGEGDASQPEIERHVQTIEQSILVGNEGKQDDIATHHPPQLATKAERDATINSNSNRVYTVPAASCLNKLQSRSQAR